MINKIIMSNVACFKQPTLLETDKRINLIYGLNGTGKSTISDFLYERDKTIFRNCTLEGLSDEEILVYNRSFINDYFYQPDSLKGIFTLSKENKEAKEKIKAAENVISLLNGEKDIKSEAEKNNLIDLSEKTQNAEKKLWEIKTKYTGGDRILEFCLDGLKGNKEVLFNYLMNIGKPLQKPPKDIDSLKKEVDAIQGDGAQKYNLLPTLSLESTEIESNQIFSKSIVGNENSSVAKIIKKLGNSDWVKEGLNFITQKEDDGKDLCPFCQEKTITPILVENIKNYFDEMYESDINELNKLLTIYEAMFESILGKDSYLINPIILERKSDFENLYNSLQFCFSSNKEKIVEKIKTPSQVITMVDSSKAIGEYNLFITEVNNLIKEHNNKIENKEIALNNAKNLFWANMRWDYDPIIFAFQQSDVDIKKKIANLKTEIEKIDNDISQQRNIISDFREKTLNIDKAISNINEGLIELGIDGFHIEKRTDDLYEIARSEECENTFATLSEGEKMIISFLYFIELCKGQKTASGQIGKKIIVIDDPISSLSHVYIFNIGQMIKNNFFSSNDYEQIFLLTHSLYFFYEMTFFNKEKREKLQKLFRIRRNSTGSQIIVMGYEEIQNDYISYWNIIKDDKQPPALIANCMRNIIEYFFNFVENDKSLNSIFQKSKLKPLKFQAFSRYINRESHSLGQNIFDIKEFNYGNFKEAFRLVFVESRYEDHYKKMMK
ncbi:MAG: AAA family ATPase [Candidatus Woesearchaeota archaeon]